ncbi:unnamed protein product [Lota lota]
MLRAQAVLGVMEKHPQAVKTLRRKKLKVQRRGIEGVVVGGTQRLWGRTRWTDVAASTMTWPESTAAAHGDDVARLEVIQIQNNQKEPKRSPQSCPQLSTRVGSVMYAVSFCIPTLWQ